MDSHTFTVHKTQTPHVSYSSLLSSMMLSVIVVCMPIILVILAIVAI